MFANLLGVIGIILAAIAFIIFLYATVWLCIIAYRAFTPVVKYISEYKKEDDINRPRDRGRITDEATSPRLNYLLTLVHRL